MLRATGHARMVRFSKSPFEADRLKTAGECARRTSCIAQRRHAKRGGPARRSGGLFTLTRCSRTRRALVRVRRAAMLLRRQRAALVLMPNNTALKATVGFEPKTESAVRQIVVPCRDLIPLQNGGPAPAEGCRFAAAGPDNDGQANC